MKAGEVQLLHHSSRRRGSNEYIDFRCRHTYIYIYINMFTAYIHIYTYFYSININIYIYILNYIYTYVCTFGILHLHIPTSPFFHSPLLRRPRMKRELLHQRMHRLRPGELNFIP